MFEFLSGEKNEGQSWYRLNMCLLHKCDSVINDNYQLNMLLHKPDSVIHDNNQLNMLLHKRDSVMRLAVFSGNDYDDKSAEVLMTEQKRREGTGGNKRE